MVTTRVINGLARPTGARHVTVIRQQVPLRASEVKRRRKGRGAYVARATSAAHRTPVQLYEGAFASFIVWLTVFVSDSTMLSSRMVRCLGPGSLIWDMSVNTDMYNLPDTLGPHRGRGDVG